MIKSVKTVLNHIPCLAVSTAMVLLLGAGIANAQLDDPVVVNLESMYDGQRLGIDVTIDSGLTEQYLFDTGSPWFTTAWATNAPWWPDASDASTDSTNFIYGPGSGENKFSAYPATNDSVSIIGTSGAVVADPIIYGEYAHYTNDPKNNIAEWKVDNSFPAAISKAVHSNTPPFQGFFGILGADLINYNDGLLNIVENQSYGTNLVKGFVVSGGPINPTLTIAPARNTLTNFTTTYPMNTNPNGSIQQPLISPSYRISWNGVSTNVTIPTLLDSGTPPKAGIVITQGSNLNLSSFTSNTLSGATYLDPGVSITALIGNTPYTLTSQNNDPIEVYGSPTNTSAGGIIYGLNFFENYNVLYDLQNKTVGIEAVPTTYVWVGGPQGSWNINTSSWYAGGVNVKVAFTSGSDAFFTNSAAVTIVSNGITAYDVAANTAGRVTLSGGMLSANSLTLQGKGSLVINNSLFASNSVAVTTNGTLSLLNSNSIGAGVNISGGGRVIIENNFSLGQGTLSVSNGILCPTAKASDILNSIVVTGGNATLSNAAAATLSGDISGMGAFTKAGAGSLSLTGSDSYAGGTTVLAGILAGTTASLEGMISNNATLIFNQSGSGTFTGSISGKGKLIDAGLGSVTMTGANTYGGGTIVTIGNLAAGSLGSGSLTLKPSKGNVSSFSDTLTSGVLDVKALTLDGSSTIDLETPYTSIRSTSAAVTILGTNNFIDLSGSWTNMGTYPLLTGTKIAGSGLKDLSLTGSFLGGATLLLGQSTNYDGYTYAFTDIINSIDLKISGMTPSVDPPFENLQIIGNDPELGGGSTEVSTVQAVPEPSTYPLLALGLLTLIIAVRRSKLSKPLFLS